MNAHELEYILLKNHLHDKESYVPRAVNQVTVSYDELLRETELVTSVEKGEIQLAVSRFMNTLEKNLSRGFKTETPMGIFAPVLQGRLDSPDDLFNQASDTNDHNVKLHWVPSRELRLNVNRNLKTFKIPGDKVRWPNLYEIKNITCPGVTEAAPGDVIDISGVNLKFNQDDQLQGLFLINSDYSYRCDTILKNSPRSLIFRVPRLEPGSYRLELRFLPRGGVLRSAEIFDEMAIVRSEAGRNAVCEQN